MDKRLKNISMAEAVGMASNPETVVYMIQRVYGDTTVEQLCAADGFYIIEEQEPEKTEKQPEKKHNVKQVDHVKIVALYTADPPRSVGWIANDMGISDQTVVNHLKKEGLWPKKEET